MKEIFIDLETTGLNTFRHGIRQISALMFVEDEPTIVFDEKINPKNCEWDSYVIENMANPEDYVNFPSTETVFQMFREFLEENCNPYDKKDKYFFYAFNAKFDEKFLRSLFQQMNDNYYGSWFHTPSIDVMTLAAEYLKPIRSSMPNFKQETIAEILGIEVDQDKLHDSLYDIELTEKIYRKLTNGKENERLD